jgi:anti-sigma factor RsiW
MSHPWAERLSEYVDGELDAADRLALEQHLVGCAACQVAVTELRRVRAWLGSDVSAEAPSKAAWLAIHARIRRRRRMRLTGIGAGLLAAAALVATLVIGSSGRSRPDVGGAASVYASATDDLEAVLRDHRSRLRPETVRELERSLATIDRAIMQARQALSADPANDYVIRSIDRLRERRLATLRDAVALTRL